MAELKLTKSQLRDEQIKLERLSKYLPTLQLKKALLQIEVNLARGDLELLFAEFAVSQEKVGKYALLLTESSATDLFSSVQVEKVHFSHENVAGVEIPLFGSVVFATSHYSLFATPLWFESAIVGIQELIIVREKIKISQEKKRALEGELKEVSIRVNLFEKILIPRALEHIKKIKIFLGDQQLAAVCQAKMAKKKDPAAPG